MIDNVILLMNGALQKKSVGDILGKCHPLGRFTEMEAVNIAETPSDLFQAVLVETPLGSAVVIPHLPVCLTVLRKVRPSRSCPVNTAGSGGTRRGRPGPSVPRAGPERTLPRLWGLSEGVSACAVGRRVNAK